jgi:hypothetical protein
MKHFIATIITDGHARMHLPVIARSSVDAVLYVMDHVQGITRLSVRAA